MNEALRQATADSHGRIESLLQFEGHFTLSHYERVMSGFTAFLLAWEPMIAQRLAPDAKPWFAGRVRGPFAIRDLAALRLSQPAPARLCIDLDGPAEVFGSMYVLEGSALGGQVISRRLAEQHGLGSSNGASYFAGWGQETGAMWREFRERMAREVQDTPANCSRSCAAAVQTFEALIAVFGQALATAPPQERAGVVASAARA